MPDQKKTLKALRCLSNPFDEERDCDNCSYDFCSCVLDVTADALELLKAQEPAKPRCDRGYMVYNCPACGVYLLFHQKYCNECGRELDWNAE